jgi:hypothetical protein
MNKEELEVINFCNITDKEWTGMWAQEAYVFNPGETKALTRFMADHFAKQLSDRILIDAGKDTSMESPERKELVEKILGKVAVPQETTAQVEPEEQLFKYETKDEAEFVDVPQETPVVSAEITEEPKKRGRKVKVA